MKINRPISLTTIRGLSLAFIMALAPLALAMKEGDDPHPGASSKEKTVSPKKDVQLTDFPDEVLAHIGSYPGITDSLIGVNKKLSGIRRKVVLNNQIELARYVNGEEDVPNAKIRYAITGEALREFLEYRPNIRALYLENCSKLTNLNSLLGLTSLSHLKLRRCKNLQDYSALSKLTNLKYLSVSGCRKHTLIPFSSLTQLTKLELDKCASLQAQILLKPNPAGGQMIPSHPNLTNLTLKGGQSLSALCGSSNYVTGLTHLKLTRDQEPTRHAEQQKLVIHPNLKHLELHGWDISANAQAAISQSGSSLTHLSLRNSYALRDISFLTYCPNLVFLELSYNQYLTKLKESISSLFTLRYLNLNHCTGLTKIKSISALLELRYLDLSHCNALINLRGLSDLPNLEYLNLSGCSIKNLGGLFSVPSLEHLDLSNCPNLSSLDGLSSIEKLEYLDVRGCPNLSKKEIKKLQSSNPKLTIDF